MRRKILFIILVLFFSTSAGLPVSADDGDMSREDIDLENAIIIRELKMEAPEPQREPESKGYIYFDDSFGKSSTVVPGKKKAKVRRARRKRKDDPSRLLRRLQKKDSRWHLSTYRVRRGDNLWNIAEDWGIPHRLLMKFNDFSDPDLLRPGRKIKVPNRRGVYHRIRRGDTLSEIAQKYKGEVDSIRDQNNIRGSRILAGKKLFIPDGRRPRYRRSHHTIASKKKIQRRKTTYRKSRGQKRKKASRIAFHWPTRGRITSGFGTRRDPFSGKRSFHCGIDISANVGTAIRASAGGRVIFSGWKSGYGKVVIIRHRGGYITVYAHNSKNLVKKNDTVRRGSLVARSGMTGAVTGAHLHFEIRKYVTPLNPMRLLK